MAHASEKIVDIQNLKHELEKALTKYHDFQLKNEQLPENMAMLTSQNAEVDKQVVVLS